jgi:CelD/BcsL family acetyltransferase involved in cellulose biosynthesis
MTIRRLPVLEALDHSGVTALGGEWTELLAASSARTPFLTWPWVSAWLDTIGRDADLVVHTARDAGDGRLLGVAPFFVARARRGGIPVRELRFLGAGLAAPDHLDLIAREEVGEPVAAALWDSIERATRWDLVDLDGITSGGHLDRLVLRRSQDDRQPIPYPHLPLGGAWEDVIARWGRTHRSNIRRYRRKLDAEAGAPVLERLVVDHAELDSTLERLATMHQAVRTAKGDPGLFADDATSAFLRAAAHRLLDAGRLRMWRLDVGDEAVAVIWCMRAFDVVSFYTTGFDSDWARYGPGRRIMARAIEAAWSEGAEEFDFLRGDENYKRSWGTEIRHDVRLRRPAGARGRLVWSLRSAARTLRRSDRDGP